MNYLEQLGAQEAYAHHNKAFGMVDELQGRAKRIADSAEADDTIKAGVVAEELEKIIDVMKESHKWVQALKG